MVYASWVSRISNLARKVMGSTAYAAYNNGAASSAASAHTVTAMGRWSILGKQLPAAHAIKAIHVYDFDNTRALLRISASLRLFADRPAAPQSSRPRSPTPSSGTARQ
jgi:hypothetical protein